MVTEPTAFPGPTGASWLASISHGLDAEGPEGRGQPEAGQKVRVTQEEGLGAEEPEVSAGRLELCPGCAASLSEAPEG